MNREDLKGISSRTCPAACTPERCVISTVNICKHPVLQGDAGCGPITIANRELAMKVIKIGQIDAEGAAQGATPAPAAKKAPQRKKKAKAKRPARRKSEPESAPETEGEAA